MVQQIRHLTDVELFETEATWIKLERAEEKARKQFAAKPPVGKCPECGTRFELTGANCPSCHKRIFDF